MAIAQAAERTTWGVVIIIFVFIIWFYDQNNIGHYDRDDGYCHTLMFIVMMIILEIGDCKAGWRKKIF